MRPVLDFLNENSSAVVAAATLVTALATAFIAVFTWGTWKLYRIEKRKVESAEIPIRHALAGLAGALDVGIEMLGAFLSLTHEERTKPALFATLVSVGASTEEVARRLDELVESAPRTSPELMLTLSGTRATIRGVHDFLPELTTDYSRDLDENLARSHELLVEAREEFRRHTSLEAEHDGRIQQKFLEALRAFSSNDESGDRAK